MIEVILRKHDSLEPTRGRFWICFSLTEEVAEAAFRNEPDFPQLRVGRVGFFDKLDAALNPDRAQRLDEVKYGDWRAAVRVYLEAKCTLVATEVLKATLSKLEQMEFAATKVER